MVQAVPFGLGLEEVLSRVANHLGGYNRVGRRLWLEFLYALTSPVCGLIHLNLPTPVAASKVPSFAMVACQEQHAPKPRVASLKLSWVLGWQLAIFDWWTFTHVTRQMKRTKKTCEREIWQTAT